MAVIEFRLLYGATYAEASGGTNVATNLLSVNAKIGRERPLDQYGANTASAVLRYPNGYATPNASWVSGTWVILQGRQTSGTWRQIFTGRISDVAVQYGIPYSGSVGNADFVTLSMEGLFAQWGRTQGLSYSMAAGIFGTQLITASAQSGLLAVGMSGYGYSTSFPATTISGTWGDWINKCVLTMNGRLIDEGDQISPVNQYYKSPNTIGNFSDIATDLSVGSYFLYDNITFASYADNYYTQITVTPDGLAAQTVQTGSVPYRSYQVNTLNNSTGQALDYANYLLSTYGTTGLRVTSISCPLNGVRSGLGVPALPVANQVAIKFRGTTYNCIVEGSAWTGTPNEARATFYVSAADQNNYLILNNTVYGTLDNNKLGY